MRVQTIADIHYTKLIESVRELKALGVQLTDREVFTNNLYNCYNKNKFMHFLNPQNSISTQANIICHSGQPSTESQDEVDWTAGAQRYPNLEEMPK